jgi:hypothetical protein
MLRIGSLRPSFFRDVTRSRLVFDERRFGTALSSSVQQSRKKLLLNAVYYWLMILLDSG